MDVPITLQKKINKDIESLKSAIADFRNEDTPESAKSELYQSVGNAYDPYIPNFGYGLYQYNPDYHFYNEVDGESLQYNLKAMLTKLETYKAFDYEGLVPPDKKVSAVTIHNNPSFQNNNANSNEITLNISFENSIKLIEDMPGLTAPETDEIIAKINEIKALVKAPEPKKRKWEKAKPIIKWIADKSVDVGMVLLPLLFKTQQ